MRTTESALFLLVVMVAASAAAAGEVIVKTKKGYAQDLDSGELIYIEEHEQRVEDGRTLSQVIRYRDPEGNVFAVKELDFTASSRHPVFKLHDQRRNYIEGLEKVGDEYFVYSVKQGEEERDEVERSDVLVADAGFDRIVEEDWDQLMTGEALKFRFLVPSRLKSYMFRLRKVDEVEYLGEPGVVFAFEPNSAFLRWLADPIEVIYDKKDKALLKYEGLSNLRDAALDNYDVLIKFPPEERAQQVAGQLLAE